jgi:glycosyltransferase involved in cell wall biosynthesis
MVKPGPWAEPAKPGILVAGPLPPPYGGPEKVTQIILQSPRLRGMFRLFHVNTQKPLTNEQTSQVKLPNLGYNLAHLMKTAWIILRYRPKMVFLFLAQNKIGFARDALFILLASLLGRRVVASREGGGFQEFYRRSGRRWQGFIRLVLRRAACVRVESRLTQRQFDGILPPSRVRVCRTGIEPRPFDAVQGPPTKTGDKVRILFMGNISVAKGAVDLVRAAAEVRDRCASRVEFRLIGEFINKERNVTWCPDPDQAEDKIRRLRQEHDLIEEVHLPGPIYGKEKIQEFAQADIFVLPSYGEGLSHALLEALAAGLPIVATKVGAMPEGVVDGVNGFLVEPGDYKALAERLAQLASDPELRRRMGHASRAILEEKFHVDQFVSCLARLFQAILVKKAWPCAS